MRGLCRDIIAGDPVWSIRMFTRVIDAYPDAWHRGHIYWDESTGNAAGVALGVIEPKLALPRVHPGMLRRARLHEMLDRDGGAALTMVDAAVGYGKTTLSAVVVYRAPGGGYLDDARSRLTMIRCGCGRTWRRPSSGSARASAIGR